MQKYRTVGEIVYAENLRPSDFVGEHMLNKSIHNDEDFDEADCMSESEVPSEESHTEAAASSQINELQVLYNAALILNQKANKIPTIKS